MIGEVRKEKSKGRGDGHWVKGTKNGRLKSKRKERGRAQEVVQQMGFRKHISRCHGAHEHHILDP